MLQLVATIFVIAIVAVVLLAIAAALAFFVGVIGYGWLRTIAPEAELAAMPPNRRRLVTVRAVVVLAAFWVILLAVNSGTRRHSNPDTGPEAFAYWRATLRRLSGLPAEIPDDGPRKP